MSNIAYSRGNKAASFLRRMVTLPVRVASPVYKSTKDFALGFKDGVCGRNATAPKATAIKAQDFNAEVFRCTACGAHTPVGYAHNSGLLCPKCDAEI